MRKFPQKINRSFTATTIVPSAVTARHCREDERQHCVFVAHPCAVSKIRAKYAVASPFRLDAVAAPLPGHLSASLSVFHFYEPLLVVLVAAAAGWCFFLCCRAINFIFPQPASPLSSSSSLVPYPIKWNLFSTLLVPSSLFWWILIKAMTTVLLVLLSLSLSCSSQKLDNSTTTFWGAVWVYKGAATNERTNERRPTTAMMKISLSIRKHTMARIPVQWQTAATVVKRRKTLKNERTTIVAFATCFVGSVCSLAWGRIEEDTVKPQDLDLLVNEPRLKLKFGFDIETSYRRNIFQLEFIWRQKYPIRFRNYILLDDLLDNWG